MKYPCEIKWSETAASTMEEARKMRRAGGGPVVAAAERQTAGRGQRGRSWLSPAGENLTFSLAAAHPGRGLSAGQAVLLGKAAALAAGGYLEAEGIDCRLKWPNDLYAGDRKIGGILIENALSDGRVTQSVIGIGLNVNQTEFDPRLPNPVSMKILTGREWKLKEELPKLAARLLDGLSAVWRTGPAAEEASEGFGEKNLSRPCRFRELQNDEGCRIKKDIEEKYLSRLYRLGELQDFRDCRTGKRFSGRISGVGEDGRLQVLLPDGRTARFAFGEIVYLPG